MSEKQTASAHGLNGGPMGKDDMMAEYLCDTCKFAKPARKSYWQTADGREWTDRRQYVRCDVRKPLWTVEKRTECWDYEKKGGKR